MTTIDPEMLNNVTGGTCPNCQQQAAAGGEDAQTAQAKRAEAKQAKRERLMAMLTPIIQTAIQTIGGVAQAGIQARSQTASAGPAAGEQGRAPTATA